MTCCGHATKQVRENRCSFTGIIDSQELSDKVRRSQGVALYIFIIHFQVNQLVLFSLAPLIV